MKKMAFWVMVATIFSKILGFSREMVLSYVYGASDITDAYLISQTIPTMIFTFLSAGMGTSFISMYSRIVVDQGRLEAQRYTNNLINVLLLLASLTTGVVMFFTRPVVKLFASGFSGETLALAITFTRISVVGVYFTAVLNIFSAFLRLHNNYIIPALIGIPMNLVTIAALFVSSRTNVYVLVAGSVVATAAQLFLLVPFVRKKGFRYQPILDLKDRYIKKMVLIILPIMIGRSVSRINLLVDRTIASSLAVGGISALNYASRLDGFIQGLFVTSLTTVLYPTIAKMAAEKDMKGLKASISEAITIVGLLVIPATIGAMLFSEQVVRLLFGRGAFTAEAIAMTSNALLFYSLGMIASGLRDILARAFYAFQDTKTPMINGTIAVVINIALNIILSRYLGIGGLALATSIAGMVSALLMFVTLRKKIGSFGLMEITKSFVKIGSASVVMGLITFCSFRFLKDHLSGNLAFVMTVGIGALIYIVLIYFLKVPEVDKAFKIIQEKIRENK